jgi:cyanophycinase
MMRSIGGLLAVKTPHNNYSCVYNSDMIDQIKLRMPGKGTLALVGSGEYLPPMEPVDRYLLSRLPGPADVVCLPTAAGTEGPERIAYWSNLGCEHFTRLGVARVEALPVIDRPSALDETLAERIRCASFVYLSGGKPDYLLSVLNDTPVWQAIVGVLDRGGVVAGCSAGAMIFGRRTATGFFTGTQKAFGFLENAFILPHFDEMPGWISRLAPALIRDLTLVGIDGNTALVCSPGDVLVEGSGGVTIGRGSQRTRYTKNI